MGYELTSAYAVATEKAFWPLVGAHVQGAAPFMLATHDRNVDPDCQDIADLKHAAKTTDPVESSFGSYDFVTILKTGVGATMGVAQSTLLHAMDTPGAKRDKAEKSVKAKRRSGVGTGATEEEQVEEQVSKWDVTSFFALSKSQRWTIIRSVRLSYKKNAKDEQALLEKMDQAKAGRNAKAREEEIAKFSNRCVKYNEFAAIPVIAAPLALDALAAKHADSPKELAEALRQQTRLRIHVFGMKRAELPLIGTKPGATDQEEAKRLLDFYTNSVKSALPPKPPAPSPFPVRAAVAAPSALAVELDRDHFVAVSAAWKELLLLLEKGIFNAPKKKPPPGPPRPNRARAESSSPRVPKERDPSASERALEGEEFEEDGIDWKVLSVRWCDEQEGVVVWYYDMEEANSSDVSEEEMSAAIEEGKSIDCLEYSSVREIRDWIAGRP